MQRNRATPAGWALNEKTGALTSQHREWVYSHLPLTYARDHGIDRLRRL